MRRYLVTGGAGFIGSNFIRQLLEQEPDAAVTNLDKLTYAGNLDNLKGVDPARHRFLKGDICDPRMVEDAMADARVVVHFAAETHVDRSLLDAAAFVRTDVEGTFVLLEAARRRGVERFLHISTDEVYGSRETGSFRESDVASPRNPYAASKLGGERLAYSYFATYGVPVVVARPSNNYGPFQHVEKLIPLFVTNALEDRPVPLYGDGRNVRDWLHVEDNCRALRLLVEKGEPGEVYNVAGGNERMNRDVAARILAVLGKPESLIRPVKDRVGHDRRYSIDASRLAALGYRPRVSFEEGLEGTVAWYRDNAWWWKKLRDAEFERYYERQYRDRERPS